MADVSFDQNLVVQQVEHRCDNPYNQHDGHSCPPSHAPVCPIVRVLPLGGFILGFQQRLLLLQLQGGHNLIEASPRRHRGLHQPLNVLVLLQEEAFHAVCGRTRVCGALGGEGRNRGGLRIPPRVCRSGGFVGTRRVSLSEDAESSHGNLN